MEFVFGFLSLLLSFCMLIGTPRLIYDSWARTKRSITSLFEGDTGILGMLYLTMGIIIAVVVFSTLCALNNSIWHIDYWSVEGLW